MSSLRRILSSRVNGARSRGPVTPEGKRRSASNATRHGLLADCVVLENESRTNFDALLASHLERLQPADGVEFGFIEEMTSAYWRMRRTWALETRILENRIAAEPPSDELDRMAAAFSDLATGPALSLMHRYETRLHRVYHRALQNLLLLRTAAAQDEPSTAVTPATPPDENAGGGMNAVAAAPGNGAQSRPEVACTTRRQTNPIPESDAQALFPNEPSPTIGH